MYTKQEIVIRSHREGKSQRCISRELGISRKTVRKQRLFSKYRPQSDRNVSLDIATSRKSMNTAKPSANIVMSSPKSIE